jgi:hypothetical protein
VSAPEPAQVGQTEVTLPFTGLPTGWVALLAIAIGGAGALLLLAARPPDKDDPLRSWN